MALAGKKDDIAIRAVVFPNQCYACLVSIKTKNDPSVFEGNLVTARLILNLQFLQKLY